MIKIDFLFLLLFLDFISSPLLFLDVALVVKVAEEHKHIHHDIHLKESKPRRVSAHVKHIARVGEADHKLQQLQVGHMLLPGALNFLEKKRRGKRTSKRVDSLY